MAKPKLALILGSGFSNDAGVPVTSQLAEEFLKTPMYSVLDRHVEDTISSILKQFWADIFGFEDNRNYLPSLEDHFTLLDLSANSGHHIGDYYSPKRLRAIRRMSIHRIFQILSNHQRKSLKIRTLLRRLNRSFELSIITLNWDTVIERHLSDIDVDYYYPIDVYKQKGGLKEHIGIPIIKMHGSMNWVYCDSCRRMFAGFSKTAVIKKTYLEAKDFELFPVRKKSIKLTDSGKHCYYCDNKLTGRVATFSYRKAFSIAQFQTIWEQANAYLRDSGLWLIIGYSMPEADFEFRHLMKSAQMGRQKDADWSAKVIVRNDDFAEKRYRRFFGSSVYLIYQHGLRKWVDSELSQFIKECGF